jgi:hypothetical protein
MVKTTTIPEPQPDPSKPTTVECSFDELYEVLASIESRGGFVFWVEVLSLTVYRLLIVWPQPAPGSAGPAFETNATTAKQTMVDRVRESPLEPPSAQVNVIRERNDDRSSNVTCHDPKTR